MIVPQPSNIVLMTLESSLFALRREGACVLSKLVSVICFESCATHIFSSRISSSVKYLSCLTESV